MPTTTRGPRTARIPARGSAGQAAGRFGRQAAAGRTRTGRTSQRAGGRRSSPDRRGIMSGKFGPIARPAPKGIGKLTSKLPGLGGSGRRGSGPGAKAKGGIGAGVALLSAAAGFALKNRDKLKRRDDDAGTTQPPVPGAGAATDPTLNGPAPLGGVDPDAPGIGGRTSPA